MAEYISRVAAIVRACKVIQDDFIAFDLGEMSTIIPEDKDINVPSKKDGAE